MNNLFNLMKEENTTAADFFRYSFTLLFKYRIFALMFFLMGILIEAISFMNYNNSYTINILAFFLNVIFSILIYMYVHKIYLFEWDIKYKQPTFWNYFLKLILLTIYKFTISTAFGLVIFLISFIFFSILNSLFFVFFLCTIVFILFCFLNLHFFICEYEYIYNQNQFSEAISESFKVSQFKKLRIGSYIITYMLQLIVLIPFILIIVFAYYGEFLDIYGGININDFNIQSEFLNMGVDEIFSALSFSTKAILVIAGAFVFLLNNFVFKFNFIFVYMKNKRLIGLNLFPSYYLDEDEVADGN